MLQALIYASVFVAALLLTDTLARALLRSRRSTREVNSRLRHLAHSDNQNSAYDTLILKRGIRSDLGAQVILDRLVRLYNQSGLEMSRPRRVSYVLFLFLIGWLIASVFVSGKLPVQLIFAFCFTGLNTLLALAVLRHRRMKKFVTQLPGTIDVIVRSLQAGHPLNAAIAMVSKEMPDPIGSEFGLLSDQLTFGFDIESALVNMQERVGVDELKLLTVTITVQSGTGGNLAEILENLAGMIRDRLMLRAKIRAISAEGRLTAVIMAVFPFGLYFVIKLLAPDYFDPLIDTGYATTVVTICLIMMGFGMIILNRMVNFDF
ncbi:type II secretion system F family protein [Aliiroseovarius crassostreae]|uniref:type II secretion system F family protein n=1 Tax=Aliiroseovarius crassostreae TaxID=154981 RepID=UPI002200E43F|nr:type II secretion system F family protein [Aliiroseovarius crassostreae]UWQ05771.1 type II secretion system F family protein [Aliiroseovarius crassostreae]